MDNRCIGMFDSGLGGLTCVKEITQILPDENIVYFGDTGRVPYGTRSAETIKKYTESDMRFLKEFDPKLVVIACGTASTTALDYVKDKFGVKVIGVVEPAAVAAAKSTINGKIGVIGTDRSINSGKYEETLKKINGKLQVFSKSCPMFVPLVENGYLDSKATYIIAKEYLKPLAEENVDTLILGCTHYPLIKKVISDIMGSNVTLIDPGKETANYVKTLLDSEIGSADGNGKVSFYVSDKVEGFKNMAEMFLNCEISGDISKIDIEKYMV